MDGKDHSINIPFWAIILVVAVSLFAIGLHIQLLEVFLSALGIGLAIVGVVGFNSIKNAAVAAAQKAVESFTSAAAQSQVVAPPVVTQPNIPPIDQAQLKVEPENQAL